MELRDNALVDWEYVRDYGNFKETQRDQVVNLVNWISSKAETIAGRPIASAWRTVQLGGNGSPRLYLPVVPVTAVSSVVVDDLHQFDCDPVDPALYHVSAANGILTLYRGCWPGGRFNIQVCYEAGWTRSLMPDEIRKAVLEAVRTAWNRQNDNVFGITSRTMPDGVNVSYETRLPAEVYAAFADLRLGMV